MDLGLIALMLAVIVVIIVFIACLLKNAAQPNVEADAEHYVKMLYGDSDNKKNKKGKKIKDDKRKKVDDHVEQTLIQAQKASPKGHKSKSQKVERTPTPEGISQNTSDEKSENELVQQADEPIVKTHYITEKKRADSHLRNDNEKLISTLSEFAISEKVLASVVEKIHQLDHYQQLSKSTRNEIEKLEKAARQQNEKIFSQEKKLSDDQRRIKDLQNNIEGEKNKYKRLDQEIGEKSHLLNATIKALKEKNDTLESDVGAMRNTIDKMADNINSEKTRAEQFRHDVAALQTERVKLINEIRRLETERQQPPKVEMVEKQQHIQSQQAAPNNGDKQLIQQLQQKLADEKHQHQTTRTDLHKLQKTHSQFEHQHNNLVERITILESDLASARVHNAAPPKSNEHDEKVIIDLQKQVEKLNLQRNETENHVNTLTHERDRLHKAYKQAESAIQSLNQKLREKEKEEANAQALQSELTNAFTTIKSLQTTVDQLKSSNELNEYDNQMLAKEITELKTRVSEAEQTRENLKSQLDDMKSEAMKVEVEKQTAADEQFIADLKQEIVDLNDKIDQLNKQLSDQNLTLNGKVDELSRERNQIQEELQEKVNMINNMNEQNAMRDSEEHNKLLADLKELQDKNQQLQDKNEELRDKNYKVLEAVTQAENTCQKVVENKAKYENQIKEQQKTIDSLNKKLAADADTNSHAETIVKEVWIEEVNGSQNGSDNAELNMLRDENERLKSSIQKLKSLQVTDTVASNSLPENEVAELQQRNEAYVETMTILREQLTSIEESARADIDKYEARCAWLAMQLEEAQSALIHSNANDKIKEEFDQLQRDLDCERVEYSTLKDQLTVLQQALDTERSTCKNLSQEAVKLRGMLKVGQEALKQEQSISANLREQLRHLQDAEHFNGM